jgi:glycine betaine/proline transport system ATP-binding protein
VAVRNPTGGPTAANETDPVAAATTGVMRQRVPARSAAPTMISCENLWKVFGPRGRQIIENPDRDLPPAELKTKHKAVIAVREVSFEVAAGEVFVVMGLSGSGKSTLVRCLTRLIEPTAGQIRIADREVTGCAEHQLRDLRRHKVAMVFQHFGLLPHRSVRDNVSYGLEIQGMAKKKRYERADEMLALVGLEGFGNSLPNQLSGGQQQRVGLARALAVDPEVLMFDEPFSALDPLIRRDMQAEVKRLHREVGKTMVFITHDLHEALKLGDRVAIMKAGGVVQIGTPAEVVGAPADDYVRAFIRDVPKASVLTAAWIAHPPDGEVDPAAPTVAADTLIRDLVPVMSGTRGLVRVVDGNQTVGFVDRIDVLQVMAEGVELT